MNTSKELQIQYELAAIAGLFARGETDSDNILKAARAFADHAVNSDPALVAKLEKRERMNAARAAKLAEVEKEHRERAAQAKADAQRHIQQSGG